MATLDGGFGVCYPWCYPWRGIGVLPDDSPPIPAPIEKMVFRPQRFHRLHVAGQRRVEEFPLRLPLIVRVEPRISASEVRPPRHRCVGTLPS